MDFNPILKVTGMTRPSPFNAAKPFGIPLPDLFNFNIQPLSVPRLSFGPLPYHNPSPGSDPLSGFPNMTSSSSASVPPCQSTPVPSTPSKVQGDASSHDGFIATAGSSTPSDVVPGLSSQPDVIVNCVQPSIGIMFTCPNVVLHC